MVLEYFGAIGVLLEFNLILKFGERTQMEITSLQIRFLEQLLMNLAIKHILRIWEMFNIGKFQNQYMKGGQMQLNGLYQMMNTINWENIKSHKL